MWFSGTITSNSSFLEHDVTAVIAGIEIAGNANNFNNDLNLSFIMRLLYIIHYQ